MNMSPLHNTECVIDRIVTPSCNTLMMMMMSNISDLVIKTGIISLLYCDAAYDLESCLV